MSETTTTGERIRARRKRLRLSQSALASLTGMDRANVAHIELGDRDILLSTLRRIADALEVDPRRLL